MISNFVKKNLEDLNCDCRLGLSELQGDIYNRFGNLLVRHTGSNRVTSPANVRLRQITFLLRIEFLWCLGAIGYSPYQQNLTVLYHPAIPDMHQNTMQLSSAFCPNLTRLTNPPDKVLRFSASHPRHTTHLAQFFVALCGVGTPSSSRAVVRDPVRASLVIAEAAAWTTNSTHSLVTCC